MVEVEQARACQNNPQNAKIQVPAYFEPYGKLGSSSLEPRAYLLQAKISARATEPKPRLVPPLWSTFKCLGADFKINFKIIDHFWLKVKLSFWNFAPNAMQLELVYNFRAQLTATPVEPGRAMEKALGLY